MNVLQFAFRNVLRNKRRSLITLMAIAIGFIAINLFGGYTANTFRGLQLAAIYGEGIGHLTIFKKGFLTEGKIDPKQYMITEEEMAQVKSLLEKNPVVQMVIPKIEASGLISNGINSTIFIAQGVLPEDEAVLKENFPYTGEGSRISADSPTGGQLASGLAKMLNFKLGDLATIMANTLDGQMNALDIDVTGIYNTGTDATNDKFMLMPLKLVQSLYDTNSVDRLVVLLDDASHTDSVRQWLFEQLPSIKFDAEIKKWNELSVFYTQVRGLFDMIFLFIFCIVLVIVVTSVINTMTMSVVERTQEVGTLRALGLKRFEVLKVFGAEGLVIGLLGVGIGVIGTIVLILLISAGNLTYVPPGIATPVQIVVDLVLTNFIFSGIFLIILSFLAAIFPSFKASRLKIVDAFGHV